MTYKVLVAQEAADRLDEFRLWWDENRPAARPAFRVALARALTEIAESPDRFPRYPDRDVRWCQIEKTPYLLLFEVNSIDRTVVVVTAWSTALGRAP